MWVTERNGNRIVEPSPIKLGAKGAQIRELLDQKVISLVGSELVGFRRTR